MHWRAAALTRRVSGHESSGSFAPNRQERSYLRRPCQQRLDLFQVRRVAVCLQEVRRRFSVCVLLERADGVRVVVVEAIEVSLVPRIFRDTRAHMTFPNLTHRFAFPGLCFVFDEKRDLGHITSVRASLMLDSG